MQRLELKRTSKVFSDCFFPELADMCVNVPGSTDIGVTKPFLYVFQIPSLVIKDAGRTMPLWYNNDKPEMPTNPWF